MAAARGLCTQLPVSILKNQDRRRGLVVIDVFVLLSPMDCLWDGFKPVFMNYRVRSQKFRARYKIVHQILFYGTVLSLRVDP